MSKVEIEEIHLIGLSLKSKTTNANGQSSIDCGNLWQSFEKENYAEIIPNKAGSDIFAVYHQYEGDHTKPFLYFVGCKVKPGAEVPQGLESLTIPKGTYYKIVAKGKMPDCVINAWKNIWTSTIPRIYQFDFEIYGEKSKDWNNAEVEVYLSIEE
ncbi:MAG: AraC family transcriptional regulator [Ferruginibacter sp.]|nr:AraC family transcriptional regulator [Ferruginibacter sp.]